MRFTVRLGATVEVWADERALPPLDRTVATLLMGLLAAEDEWTSRREIARRLYPDADPAASRNALRQAFFRLRRLLGAEVVESRAELVRLLPGSMVAVWETDAATWPDHPWASAIRETRRSRDPEPLRSHFDAFSWAVESAAEVDQDAARGILVGGMALAHNLPHRTGTRLLRLTAPTSGHAPFAFEYLDLCGGLQIQWLAVERARATYGRAYRLALGRRNAAQAVRAAAMSTFAHIEAGDMAAAAAWLDRCARHARGSSPILANAHATFLWNAGHVGEAVERMRENAPSPDAADSLTRLHYWTNAAALAAESGEIEFALEAETEVRGLATPSVHLGFLHTLEFARASRLMGQGLLDESLRAFQGLVTRAEGTGRMAERVYADEGYAEALARAGEVRQAVEVWSRAEAKRRAMNVHLTPRLAARKARILRRVG